MKRLRVFRIVAGLYQALEEALLKLKSNKDVTSFQNMLKRITADQKTETQAVAELQAIIKVFII